MAVQQQAIDNSQAPAEATAAAPVRKNLLQLMLAWPTSRKLATVAILLVTVALFAVIIIQARTANQQLLYANLALADASQVVGWLKNQKIAYSLKNGGKDIWIPADQIYQARLDLAANGLPSGGGVGFEVFDKQSFALTDYVQKVNHTRALQGELARTISSLEPVEATRVHLAIPEKRVFKDEQKNATASVIVTLVPGMALDQQQVQGIIHLVAGSVSGLLVDNVKVIDSTGVVLEAEKPVDEREIFSADMLAFQQEVEGRLELRVQDLLSRTLGRDNSAVKVSATLDFARVEKTQELFDAEEPVIRSEQLNQEMAAAATAGGIPGVESNLQGLQGNPGEAGSNITSSSKTTNYEISKTVARIVNPVGTITKLSISVLVADKVSLDGEGNPESTTPRTAEELEAIRNMVSSAIGLDTARGDQINVISMPFVAADSGFEMAADTQTDIYQYLPFLKYGLITIASLLVYFMMLRPLIKTMRGEVTTHYKTVEQMQQEQLPEVEIEPEDPPLPIDDAITALRREVMRNQVPTAFILKNWIQEG